MLNSFMHLIKYSIDVYSGENLLKRMYYQDEYNFSNQNFFDARLLKLPYQIPIVIF
jgi:hypothetical protein